MKKTAFKTFGILVLLFQIFLTVSVYSQTSEKMDASLAKAFSESIANDEQADLRFGQKTKLTANDGATGDNFGYRVAIAGNTAVIGAWQDDVGANESQGSAYVFVRGSNGVWTQQAKLTASDGAAFDYFGGSVAIGNVNAPSQTVIIVGALGNDANGITSRGAAYVFTRASGGTTWSSGTKLTASDGAARDNFGYSVAISGSLAIIGSPADDIGANGNQGSAYIFARNGTVWEEEQKLVAWDGDTNDLFGWSVGISGPRVIIGAPDDDIDNNMNQGSSYVFERTAGNTWNSVTKLRLSSVLGATSDYLGISVGISGNTVIVGAYGTDVITNADQGEAVIWTISGTTVSAPQRLRASDGNTSDLFGLSVAISGDTAVIGSPQSQVPNIGNTGATYIFKRIGEVFVQDQKLTVADGQLGDTFGRYIAISNDTLISGAVADDIGSNTDQGSAYIFNLSSNTPFDFDGDSKTDVSIFRPSVGQWWYLRSSDSSNRAFSFGNSADKLAPGDYTGDGRTDICFFRPSEGTWYVLRSEDSSFFSFPFGTNSDVPAPADYDGDGITDPAVFRPSTATWFISKSTGGTLIVNFGSSEDKPVVADYDGDGKADIAIFRPSVGQWWYLRSSDNSSRVFNFGVSTDKLVPGDYTGDGKADIAFWRPSDGNWYILRSEDSSFFSFPFGLSGDIPAPGDYDGDGKFDPTVFRPSSATWFASRSTAGFIAIGFGSAEDKPVPSAFIP